MSMSNADIDPRQGYLLELLESTYPTRASIAMRDEIGGLAAVPESNVGPPPDLSAVLTVRDAVREPEGSN
ncbi:hypothetical protein [Brachybacterium sp. J153]|uniref:hypothetical protein n=1 Tax=Brachybacterium sp. J153 TaxID=3116488 RepID=UPI002E793C25|nr:hypothetical protein [Brachybacterium sp. J153]MEE1616990.1 hypothetical protein [Brachybacterium sp. J153]